MHTLVGDQMIKGIAGVGGTALGVGGGIAAHPVSAAAVGNTLLAGKGVGLGLGLGAWGPVLFGVAGLACAASLYDYLMNRKALAEASAEPA
jgi:hypothetical protein